MCWALSLRPIRRTLITIRALVLSSTSHSAGSLTAWARRRRFVHCYPDARSRPRVAHSSFHRSRCTALVGPLLLLSPLANIGLSQPRPCLRKCSPRPRRQQDSLSPRTLPRMDGPLRSRLPVKNVRQEKGQSVNNRAPSRCRLGMGLHTARSAGFASCKLPTPVLSRPLPRFRLGSLFASYPSCSSRWPAWVGIYSVAYRLISSPWQNTPLSPCWTLTAVIRFFAVYQGC